MNYDRFYALRTKFPKVALELDLVFRTRGALEYSEMMMGRLITLTDESFRTTEERHGLEAATVGKIFHSRARAKIWNLSM